ncbi:MotE family protein [Aliiroseovarius sp. CAU 1755]
MNRPDNPDSPPRTSRRKSTNRRILLFLAIMLASSGLVRLGPLGMAVADDVTTILKGTSAEPVENDSCKSDADIERLLAALQNREAAVAKRETALEDRLKALSVADEQIARKMDALIVAEQKLAATMATAKTAAADDLNGLTTLYENMKPKQAIPLFEEMAPEFAAGFLSRMKAPIAAQIMAGLKPQTAYAISVVLAGRHTDVPTN